MASFQPNLNQPQAQNPVSGSFSSNLNLGAFGDIIAARKRAAANQQKINEDFGNTQLVNTAADLEAQANALEHQYTMDLKNLELLQQGGITEDEEDQKKVLMASIEKYRNSRDQGIGNATIRRNRMLTAVRENFMASAEFKKALLESDLGQKLEKTPAEKQLDNVLRVTYGQNYNEDDIKEFRDMMAKSANLDLRMKLGGVRAAELMNEGREIFLDASTITMKQYLAKYDEQGFFFPHDEDNLKRDLKAKLMAADKKLTEYIIQSEAMGRPIDITQQTALKNMLREEHDKLFNFITEEKDMVTRLKLFEDIKRHSFAVQAPWMLSMFNAVADRGGFESASAFVSVMKDDTLKRIAMSLGQGFLAQIDGDIDKALADVFNLMLSDIDIPDPSLKALQSTVANMLLKKGIDPKPGSGILSQTIVNFGTSQVREAVRKGSELGINSTIASTASMWLNDTAKREMVQGMNTQTKSEIRNTVASWVSNVATMNAQLAVESEGSRQVSYNAIKEVYIPQGAPKRDNVTAFSFMGSTPKPLNRVERYADTLNALLELARDPDFSSVVPSTKEIATEVKRITDEAIKAAEEEKRIEEENRARRQKRFEEANAARKEKLSE